MPEGLIPEPTAEQTRDLIVIDEPGAGAATLTEQRRGGFPCGKVFQNGRFFEYKDGSAGESIATGLGGIASHHFLNMKTLFRIALSLHLSLLSIVAAEKPNFLFIIVDDQSPFDLKAYDPDSILETPNIDRIARDGLVFDGAHQQARGAARFAPAPAR